jgi:phage replication O-like protein O
MIGNPQLEKGYTRIANELLQVLCFSKFSSAELRIILLLIRQTYGWRRKKTFLTANQISHACLISLRHTKRVVSKLIKENVLIREKDEKGNFLIGLNKRYLQWQVWKSCRKKKSRGDSSDTLRVTGESLGR